MNDTVIVFFVEVYSNDLIIGMGRLHVPIYFLFVYCKTYMQAY